MVAERAQLQMKKHLQIKKTSSSIWQHMLQILTTQSNKVRCKNKNTLQIGTDHLGNVWEHVWDIFFLCLHWKVRFLFILTSCSYDSY